MLNKLPSLIQNKRIVILGFGMEGQSSFRFLTTYFPNHRFLIADSNPEIKNHPLLQQNNFIISKKEKKIIWPQNHLHRSPSNKDTKAHEKLTFRKIPLVIYSALEHWWQKNSLKKALKIEISTGKSYLNTLQKDDFVVKSPGIKLPADCKLDSSALFSQTDLFIQAFQNQIIGITGTKGKSTTSSLLTKILKEQNKDVILIGNIGKPAFDYWDKIENDTFIVFELSAHQLEYTRFSPKYSILLNLFPEHLDYFKTADNYFKAKLNIAKFQSEIDFFFLGDSSNEKIVLESIQKKPTASKYQIKDQAIFEYSANLKILASSELLYLKGIHQLKNCIPLLDLGEVLKLNEAGLLESIKTFKPLPHRIEFIGKVKEICFYNDSISTIPEATIEALKALGTVNYLILGGLDRTLNYEKLYQFLDSYPLERIIFFGPAGKRMQSELPDFIRVETVYIEKLQHIESYLKEILNQNKSSICLLSPAAASYDAFKNFEERGDFFRGLVEKLM